MLSGSMPMDLSSPAIKALMGFDEAYVEKLKQEKEAELKAQLDAKSQIESVRFHFVLLD